MHECVYMHMYSVYVVYVVPMMHVGTFWRFAGVLYSVRLGMLCWSAVQCSTQRVADMALHRSYGVVPSAAVVQVGSAMTKVTSVEVGCYWAC